MNKTKQNKEIMVKPLMLLISFGVPFGILFVNF